MKQALLKILGCTFVVTGCGTASPSAQKGQTGSQNQGDNLHTCTDIDSNSNFVFQATKLEGIPKVTFSKLESFQGKPLETAEYTWSSGVISGGSGVKPYLSVFSSFKKLSVLPKQFELEYIQSEAKEFPAFVVLKIANGTSYDVFKLTCSP